MEHIYPVLGERPEVLGLWGDAGPPLAAGLGDGAAMLPHLQFPGSLPFRGDTPELSAVASRQWFRCPRAGQ